MEGKLSLIYLYHPLKHLERAKTFVANFRIGFNKQNFFNLGLKKRTQFLGYH